MKNVTEKMSNCGSGSNNEITFQEATRIFLLGRTEARGTNGEKLLPNARKTKAVFAYLCLCRGEMLARARIADLIWDRSGSVQSLDALRHALADLSHIGSRWRLERERHTVRLDTRACWIDAFEVPDRPDRLLDDLQGVSVSFDHWIMEERARFETRWRAVLERNLENLIAENAVPARRASAARDLLAVLPTHDAAVRALMKAFIDMDEPGGGDSGVRTAPTTCRRCRNTGGSRDIRPVLRDPGGTTSATIAPVGGPAAERSPIAGTRCEAEFGNRQYR